MRLLILLVAAFAAVNCYPSTDASEELVTQLRMKMLRDRLRQRSEIEQVRSKLEQICPGYGVQLENVTMRVQSCVGEVDLEEETICSFVKNHFQRCSAPLTETLEECLPTQSNKIPSMATKMIVATTKHLCKSDGEHIFELANPCIRNTNLKTQICVRRLATRFQEFERRKKYPSAQEVCEIFEGLRPCLQSHLNSACGHPITRESYLQIYDEMLSVCKTYEFNEIEVVDPSLQ